MPWPIRYKFLLRVSGFYLNKNESVKNKKWNSTSEDPLAETILWGFISEEHGWQPSQTHRHHFSAMLWCEVFRRFLLNLFLRKNLSLSLQTCMCVLSMWNSHRGVGHLKPPLSKGTLDFQDFTAFFSLVFYSSEGGS